MGQPFNLSSTDLWKAWQVALNPQAWPAPLCPPVLLSPHLSVTGDGAADISNSTWAFVEVELKFLILRTE